MTPVQAAEIKLKKYEGLNDDDPLVMQVSEVPHLEVLIVQGQSGLHGNNPYSNQVPRINWTANLTCHKCRGKGYLAQECP